MGNRIAVPGAADPVVSGPGGSLESHARWTSHPQHFRDNGYLVAGTDKILHTEEGGAGHEDPVENGPGMPPNEDPRSWSTGLSMQKVNDVANSESAGQNRPCRRTLRRSWPAASSLC